MGLYIGRVQEQYYETSFQHININKGYNVGEMKHGACKMLYSLPCNDGEDCKATERDSKASFQKLWNDGENLNVSWRTLTSPL